MSVVKLEVVVAKVGVGCVISESELAIGAKNAAGLGSGGCCCLFGVLK